MSIFITQLRKYHRRFVSRLCFECNVDCYFTCDFRCVVAVIAESKHCVAYGNGCYFVACRGSNGKFQPAFGNLAGQCNAVVGSYRVAFNIAIYGNLMFVGDYLSCYHNRISFAHNKGIGSFNGGDKIAIYLDRHNFVAFVWRNGECYRGFDRCRVRQSCCSVFNCYGDRTRRTTGYSGHFWVIFAFPCNFQCAVEIRNITVENYCVAFVNGGYCFGKVCRKHQHFRAVCRIGNVNVGKIISF